METYIISENTDSRLIGTPCIMKKLLPNITRVDGMGAIISSMKLPKNTPNDP
jgi:hypothetical protein